MNDVIAAHSLTFLIVVISNRCIVDILILFSSVVINFLLWTLNSWMNQEILPNRAINRGSDDDDAAGDDDADDDDITMRRRRMWLVCGDIRAPTPHQPIYGYHRPVLIILIIIIKMVLIILIITLMVFLKLVANVCL